MRSISNFYDPEVEAEYKMFKGGSRTLFRRAFSGVTQLWAFHRRAMESHRSYSTHAEAEKFNYHAKQVKLMKDAMDRLIRAADMARPR